MNQFEIIEVKEVLENNVTGNQFEVTAINGTKISLTRGSETVTLEEKEVRSRFSYASLF